MTTNLRSRFFSILSLLMLVVTTALGAQEGAAPETADPAVSEITASIAWEAVPGASGYIVVVRHGETVFLQTKTTETRLDLNIVPLNYEYEVQVLNRFGKVVSTSGWLPLVVERSLIPAFRIEETLTGWESKGSITFEITSPVFRKGIRFGLVQDDLIIEQKNWTLVEGGAYMTIELEGLPPGSWGIGAMDPSGYTFLLPNALIVRPRRSPEITALTPGVIPLIPSQASVVVEGTNFDEGFEAVFQGEGVAPKIRLAEVTADGNARLWLDLTESEIGIYGLTVTNPSGAAFTIEEAVEVQPAVADGTAVISPRLEIHAGYPLVFAPVGGADMQLASVLGFELAFTVDAGWSRPFLRGLGFEAGTMFNLISENFTTLEGFFWAPSFSFWGGGYYRPEWKSPVLPVFTLTVGNRMFWNPGSSAENLFLIRTGFGIDILKDRSLWRFGVTLEWQFFNEMAMPIIVVDIRRGFRF